MENLWGAIWEAEMTTAKNHRWVNQELPLGTVRERADFQMRTGGLSQPHVGVLKRAMLSGKDIEPVRVAKIGKAHYLVDGFHRLEAARQAGHRNIGARVATMSLQEARDYALLANTKHGRPPKPKDKAYIFAQYVERRKHLDALGTVKASRTIAAELNHVYSHETVRQKLKKLGAELDEAVEFPEGYKPYGPTEDELAGERADEAREYLDTFADLFFTLDDGDRTALLVSARGLVDSLERGERPERLQMDGELDI